MCTQFTPAEIKQALGKSDVIILHSLPWVADSRSNFSSRTGGPVFIMRTQLPTGSKKVVTDEKRLQNEYQASPLFARSHHCYLYWTVVNSK